MGRSLFEVIGVFACLMAFAVMPMMYSSQDAWAEGGLRIVDQYAYPKLDVNFEEDIEVSPVCTEQDDPSNRYTCAFTINRIGEIEKAEAIANNLIGKNQKVESFSQDQFDYNIVPIQNDKENCFEGENQNIKSSCEIIRRIQDEVHAKLVMNDIVDVGQKSNSNLSAKQIDAVPKIDSDKFSKFFENLYGPFLPRNFHLSSIDSSQILPVYGPHLAE